MNFTGPSHDCPLCPRLAGFREENRVKYPTFFNGPVPSFGALDAEFLVVGLAPGLKGANQTGRPFTGDYAGIILYSALQKSGFAEGKYDPEAFIKPSPSGRGLGEGASALKRPLPPKLLSHARELRRNTTNAEQILWSVLRDRPLGFKFRRQHPVPPYVVDFFCHDANLVIELDGGQHSEDHARQKDMKRTEFLKSKGYRVLRFWNNEVLENMEGVFDIIAQALPHPGPLPEGEGDSFCLINCRITNGVRCVPQANKPEPSEIKTCNSFLKKEIAAMPKLKVILSLGGVSHKAVLMAFGKKQSAFKFGHAAEHKLDNVVLLNSYHTSRYNINTGALTQAMFDKVIERARALV